MENDLIHADMVEATEFPDLSTQYEVHAVPKTIINDRAFIEGASPEDHLLQAIVDTLEEDLPKSKA